MANAKGVDVSHWQSLSDWSPTGLSFVIVKASEGLTKDAMYAKHVAKGRAAGLVVGAYAFNRDDVDIVAQAKFFATASADADMHFIDVEGTHAFSQAQTRLFMDTFRSVTHRPIGLYHSASGFFDAGQDYDWVAHWGVTQPSRSWDFHQYRGSPLDLDQYNGTADELRARFLGGSMAFQQVNVPKGTWLYVNSDLSGNANNLQVDPGRPMLLVKANATASTHLLMHDTNFKHYYVRKSDVSLTPLITEADCPVAPPCPPPTADECKVFSDAAYTQGKTDGLAEGQAIGYDNGYRDGYTNGYNDGVPAGHDDGVIDGIAQEQTRIKGVLGLE